MEIVEDFIKHIENKVAMEFTRWNEEMSFLNEFEKTLEKLQRETVACRERGELSPRAEEIIESNRFNLDEYKKPISSYS